MLSCFSRDKSRRSLNSASPCVAIVCPDTGDSTASANSTSNIRTNVGTFQMGYTTLSFKLQEPEGNLHNTQRQLLPHRKHISLPKCQISHNTAFCRKNSIQFKRPHKQDIQITYIRTIKARSCPTVTAGKQHVLHVTNVSVALTIQHAKRGMRHFIRVFTSISVACLADPHFYTLSWVKCVCYHLMFVFLFWVCFLFCVFCLCIVLCTVSPLGYSCLFTICVQVKNHCHQVETQYQ
jgi:hypothetical protein